MGVTAGLTKAILENADTSAQILECHFNPNELSIARTNTWKPASSKGSALKDVNFDGMGPRTMQITLTFDTYESPSNKPLQSGWTPTSVTTFTDKLAALMQLPDSVAPTDKNPRPPHVRFRWGQFSASVVSFPAVITQMTQKFTLFDAAGTPVRATVTLSLQEVPDKTKQQGQNPTTQTVGVRRVREVQPGDTIDWIAADVLGDAGKWRKLAEANNVDDPRRLRPGQTLVIPPDA
jgi:hypothetical protein